MSVTSTHQPGTPFNRFTFATTIHNRLTDRLVDISTIQTKNGLEALNLPTLPVNVKKLRRMFVAFIYSTITPSHSSSCTLRGIAHILQIHLHHTDVVQVKLHLITYVLHRKLRHIICVHHTSRCYQVAGNRLHQCK